MNPDRTYLASLDEPQESDEEPQALETRKGFSYRQAIGELIYAMVTTRPDISFPVIKLSQFSTKRRGIHYDAVKEVFAYLYATKSDGIYYWRKRPIEDLPAGIKPSTREDNFTHEVVLSDTTTKLIAFSDSDWAGDLIHRRSVTGIAVMYAGGVVCYKTKYQETIALSSTEAEFVALCDAGKVVLYARSILDDLNVPQDNATVLFEDNRGALLMAQQRQPTKRTRHMEVKYFAVSDWVEKDLITVTTIPTAENVADVFTKQTPRILFYRHYDKLMGRVVPSYVQFK